MSWQAQDKEAMQKFLRESILQLCRINIGMPGSYEVDGIICITRGSRNDVDGNVDEDQIVVKVHEQITTNVHPSVCRQHPDASVLREYLASQNVTSRLMRNAAAASPLLNLKRKTNDENDNAIIDISCDSGNKSLMTDAKLLRHDVANQRCDELESSDQMKVKPSLHTQVAKVSAGNSDVDISRLESYSCGSCLLDFDSWISLEGHFEQSHTSCLEHYCRTCAVGFLSSADLGKHNSSVHKLMLSTAVVGSRRKQNKPRRGVMNNEASAQGENTHGEMELSDDWFMTKHRSGDTTGNDVAMSSLRPLLQKRPLTKMMREDNVTVVKQEQLDDLNCNAASSEIVSERICPHCTSFFSDFSTFSVHCRAVHHRFPCPHCLQTFTQRVNRDRHLYNHTGERPFGCATCGDGFTRRDVLRKHQQKCSHSVGIAENIYGEQNTDGAIPFSDDDSEADINMNDECGLDLSMPSDFSRTLQEESKRSKSISEEDSVSCVVSKQNVPKSFTHSHPLTTTVTHPPLPTRSMEWTDVERGSRFQSSDPTDGAGTAPTAMPPQPVTEGRWYSCDICRAPIAGAAAFEIHCRSEHRRTPCVYCGKTFSQKGNMERHQRQHTGERPFACPHCSCSYTRKETLKVHINQAHPATAPSDAADGHREAQSAAVFDTVAGH